MVDELKLPIFHLTDSFLVVFISNKDTALRYSPGFAIFGYDLSCEPSCEAAAGHLQSVRYDGRYKKSRLIQRFQYVLPLRKKLYRPRAGSLSVD